MYASPETRLDDDWMEEWSVEPVGYSVEKFYCSVGKAEVPASFRLPASLMREVDELVASGVIPSYACASDVYRDALYHRLQYLAEQRRLGNLRRILGRQFKMYELSQRQAEMREHKELVDMCQTTLREAHALGDVEMLHETIDSMRSDETLTRLRDPWKTELQAILSRYDNR